VWFQLLQKPRHVTGQDFQKGSLLGPRYGPDDIGKLLNEKGAVYQHFRDEDELLDHVAQQMAEEKVVGWLHGRMEFGPRALGARSIIGDPRSPRIQATMNLKIKFRESFRPFAPCVLREHVHEWFGMRPQEDSPYMLLVAPVLEERRVPLSPEDQERMRTDPDLLRRVNLVRSQVPAITHVDYSARVQTVDERHGRFYRLMKKFHEKTGCPIIVNTSFNLSWEPIVESPQEAYHTFMQSEMDVLVLEDCVLHKAQQPLGLQAWSQADGPDAASPWADPLTGGQLVMTPVGATNSVTGAHFAVEEGIPRLFVPTVNPAADLALVRIGKDRSRGSPFPSYEKVENRRALHELARRSLFARLLNEQLPYNARILEFGCGTGQLTNYLSMAHRSVLGVDDDLHSLRLAQKFKTDHGLDSATFAHMNLSRPALRENFFDYVVSNDLPARTDDRSEALRHISRLIKPGGHIILGLRNAYSHKLRPVRQALSRWFGRGRGSRSPFWPNGGRRKTTYTLDEVLTWMAQADLEIVRAIPSPGGQSLAPENLFASQAAGNRLSRLLSQLFSRGEEGFFLVIGRRMLGAVS
jgi:ubiquinone/menaquinone biosynthesis C-methylase UbiE/AcrR family transcriptional regulator